MAMICLVYRLAKVAAQDLKIVAVGVIKRIERVAINVEYTVYLIMCDEGNDYLRTRTATTSDMSRELLYIGTTCVVASAQAVPHTPRPLRMR